MLKILVLILLFALRARDLPDVRNWSCEMFVLPDGDGKPGEVLVPGKYVSCGNRVPDWSYLGIPCRQLIWQAPKVVPSYL